MYGIMLTLLTVSVSAMDDVDVNCHEGFLNSEICRDSELQDEFDEVTDYVSGNEADWLKDTAGVTNNYNGGGIGMHSLSSYLVGIYTLFEKFDTLIDYLLTVFATKDDLEPMYQRIEELECKVKLPEASIGEHNGCVMQKRATRLNEILTLNKIVYEP